MRRGGSTELVHPTVPDQMAMTLVLPNVLLQSICTGISVCLATTNQVIPTRRLRARIGLFFFFFIKKKNFTFLKLLLFSIIAGVSLFPEAEPPEATALWPWSRE